MIPRVANEIKTREFRNCALVQVRRLKTRECLEFIGFKAIALLLGTYSRAALRRARARAGVAQAGFG